MVFNHHSNSTPMCKQLKLTCQEQETLGLLIISNVTETAQGLNFTIRHLATEICGFYAEINNTSNIKKDEWISIIIIMNA